jgi:hypothetical protein
MIRIAASAGLCLLLLCWCAPRASAVQPIDKIVIVIEENNAPHAVLGGGEAPFLDSLAAGGARFDNMFALTHPSQPNYLHLFSGAHQGVSHNFAVADAPLTTPNLGAAMLQAGQTFVGYSESLPSVGYTGLLAEDGAYARRHNPWVNWQADAPGPNQLPPSVNQPFTAFPSDFSLLPRVSIVVPNNNHNAHDGTIAEMDAWLHDNLLAYAQWAQANNSLLIVAFDEDDYLSRNRVPTVVYGANVVPAAVVSTTWTSHNLLRTVANFVGVAPPGSAADVRPIVGAFTTDPAAQTVSFQQGRDGYSLASDTTLVASQPAVSYGGDVVVHAQHAPALQGLIRFDDVIGPGGDRVPAGAKILSAKLVLHTSLPTVGVATTVSLHAMQAPWRDADSWDALTDGVSANDVEAAAATEFALTPNWDDDYAIFDVTRSVQAWAHDLPNFGWLLSAAGPDGWQATSSESPILADRPRLEVTFIERAFAADFNNDGAVDAADLACWTASAGGVDGDADDDGDSDGADFVLWQRQLGSRLAVATDVEIPEPPTFVLVAALACRTLSRRTTASRREDFSTIAW